MSRVDAATHAWAPAPDRPDLLECEQCGRRVRPSNVNLVSLPCRPDVNAQLDEIQERVNAARQLQGVIDGLTRQHYTLTIDFEVADAVEAEHVQEFVDAALQLAGKPKRWSSTLEAYRGD